MAVAAYTKSGAKSSSPAKLGKSVFGVEVKSHDLIKTAYLAYLAQQRSGPAKTKKRGEVRGGGAKPWRQKGTGRARFGSSRNPVWVGGGVAFGPTGNENHRLKMSISTKRTAVRQAFSLAAAEDRISIIDDFSAIDGKTKKLHGLLIKIGADKDQTLLITDAKKDQLTRAAANLPNVKLVSAGYANVYDIVSADKIVISKPAIPALEARLSVSRARSEAKS